jgi:tetratricopeptide (TPR) repeat protein
MRDPERCWFIAAALLIVTPGTGRAQEPDSRIGSRVITKFGAVLRVGKQVVADAKRGASPQGGERLLVRVYRVERINGPWLWLVAEKGGARGWVPAGDVVSLDRATEYFTAAIRAKPSAAAYLGRGVIWSDQRDYDKAIADYTEAIRLDPGDEIAYTARGNAWRARKEYEKAIADYTEALRVNPRYALAFNNRGNAWWARKEYEKAIADYTEALRLDPKDARAYGNRGISWRAQKEIEKAIADYTEAIRLDPTHASAYITRGHAWSDKKEYEKAIADYTEAIRLDPKDASGYSNRGSAWSAKKEYDKAIADFTEAIRLDPKYASAYLSRGQARRARKDYDKALADFAEAIRLDPRSARAYAGRAWLWATCPDATHRDGQRAVESATRACTLSEWKDATDLGTLAAACAESGDFATAVKWQTQAIDLLTDETNKESLRACLKLYQDQKPYREEP